MILTFTMSLKEVYEDKKVMIILILLEETADVISSDLTFVEGYIWFIMQWGRYDHP